MAIDCHNKKKWRKWVALPQISGTTKEVTRTSIWFNQIENLIVKLQ